MQNEPINIGRLRFEEINYVRQGLSFDLCRSGRNDYIHVRSSIGDFIGSAIGGFTKSITGG